MVMSRYFLAELTNSISTRFKKGMLVMVMITSERGDFLLDNFNSQDKQEFGFAYKTSYKKLH